MSIAQDRERNRLLREAALRVAENVGSATGIGDDSTASMTGGNGATKIGGNGVANANAGEMVGGQMLHEIDQETEQFALLRRQQQELRDWAGQGGDLPAPQQTPQAVQTVPQAQQVPAPAPEPQRAPSAQPAQPSSRLYTEDEVVELMKSILQESQFGSNPAPAQAPQPAPLTATEEVPPPAPEPPKAPEKAPEEPPEPKATEKIPVQKPKRRAYPVYPAETAPIPAWNHPYNGIGYVLIQGWAKAWFDRDGNIDHLIDDEELKRLNARRPGGDRDRRKNN